MEQRIEFQGRECGGCGGSGHCQQCSGTGVTIAGREMRWLRRAYRITVGEMADYCGVSKAMISYLETDQRRWTERLFTRYREMLERCAIQLVHDRSKKNPSGDARRARWAKMKEEAATGGDPLAIAEEALRVVYFTPGDDSAEGEGQASQEP